MFLDFDGVINTFLKEGELFTGILKCEMGLTLQKKSEVSNVKVIRFEDLKTDSENTLKALCEWLNISYLDILLSTTLNGITIYFPTVYSTCVYTSIVYDID